MRLKDYIKKYEAERGPNDYLHVFFEGMNGRRETINIANLSKEKIDLMSEADLVEAYEQETEYTAFAITGKENERGTLKIYSARLDSDQALIALGIHPALRKPKRAKGRFTLKEAE